MTKEEAIELVKQNALALKNLDAKFKKDREIVLAAVGNHGLALGYASEALKMIEK
jgi:threonine dehydratase